MKNFPDILIVDDNKKELDILHQAFISANIPVFPIFYDREDSENESGVDHVKSLMGSSPRIVVTDLNLQENQSNDPVQLVGPIAKVLECLVTKKTPYYLIVWSKLPNIVEKIIGLLESRFSDTVTLPMGYSVIQKDDYLTNSEALPDKIVEIISENKLISALLSWESSIRDAAKSTIDQLFSVSFDASKNKDIESINKNFEEILSFISRESIAQKHAKEDPWTAVHSALLPVLIDKLSEQCNEESSQFWLDAFPNISKSRLKVEDSVKPILNSFYFLKSNDDRPFARGAFVSMDNEFLGENRNMSKFTSLVGRDLDRIVCEEFITESRNKWEEHKISSSNLIIGFLETSAECDYAQKKVKLPRYLLGILIPVEYEEYTKFKTSSGNAHNGIYRLPSVRVGERDYIFKVSYKYQFGTQPIENKWFGNTVFRLRDEVLASISHGYSTHTSRPGIMALY
jgi:hypothetical protein